MESCNLFSFHTSSLARRLTSAHTINHDILVLISNCFFVHERECFLVALNSCWWSTYTTLQIELVCRIAVVLLQTHYNQLVTTPAARSVLTVLKDVLYARVKVIIVFRCSAFIGLNSGINMHKAIWIFIKLGCNILFNIDCICLAVSFFK